MAAAATAPSSQEAILTVDVHAAEELVVSGHKCLDVSSQEAILTVDVHAAKELVSSGHKCLDVRTVEEFKKGHFQKALNVPYMFLTPQGRVKNPEFVEQVSAICDKDDHIVVGCQSGVRSLKATEDLLGAGFKHVKNMGGGYAAWVENGFAIHTIKEDL